jgi:hypothetical protein
MNPVSTQDINRLLITVLIGGRDRSHCGGRDRSHCGGRDRSHCGGRDRSRPVPTYHMN